MNNSMMRVSPAVLAWLKSLCDPGESLNDFLERLAGFENTSKVSKAKGGPDKRQKYPVLTMLPGEEIVVPWNRDANGNAQVVGLNASVARCNRLPGRKYRSTAISAGLHIVRIT